MVGGMTVVDRNGQVTIPAEIREALGLKEGDQVEVTLENGHARLVPGGSVVDRTAGMLKHGGPVLSAEEERAAFEQAVADDVMERMNRDAEQASTR